jgi:hypothetical protein
MGSGDAAIGGIQTRRAGAARLALGRRAGFVAVAWL